LDVHGGGIVNPSENPNDLTIIHAGNKVHLKDTMDFYGYIVAPNAKIMLEQGTEYFGGLIGKEVEFKKNSHFHADQSLSLDQSLSFEGTSGRPALVR
jgi:hypothetical protein